MSASDVSLSSHHMSHHPLTLAAGRFCLVVVLVFVAWAWCLLPALQVSWDFVIPPRLLDLDDRQASPLVRLRSKKKTSSAK